MDRSKRPLTAMILCIALLCLCAAAPGKIIYVDDDAPSGGDGSSWASAYRFMQDALADANDSAKPVEIYVAQGLYKPDQGGGRKAGAPEETFQLISGVALRGGYAGLGAPDPNARDIKLYESILSGDLTDDDFSAPPEPDIPVRILSADLAEDDPNAFDPRDLAYGVGWNSKTVVTGSGTDSTAVLEGFTITGGRHHLAVAKVVPGQPSRFRGSGGGMNNHVGSPTVIACTFTRNMSQGSGAGMCNVEGSRPRIIDCIFTANYCQGGGGGGAGLANWNDSRPTVIRCAFIGNVARGNGGGTYSHRSSPVFEGCTFSGNSADDGGGGVMASEQSTCALTDCTFEENCSHVSGGALYVLNDSNMILDDCTFTRNRSEGPGGAIYEVGEGDSLTLSHCIFKQNSSSGYEGGALSLFRPAQLTNCTFDGNSCYHWGGAACVRGGTFTNCLFTGNRAKDNRAPLPSQGGAVYASGNLEPLHFINCTFAENQASWGSAVCTDRSTESRNCILRGPGLLIWADPYEPQPQVTYCNVEHAWPGEGNIDVNPLFAMPGRWADPDDPNSPGDPNDPNAIWVAGDYHLKSQAGRWDPNSQTWVKDSVTSPCIDAGDPNSPVGEEPSPNGGRINMGAYGGTSEASMSYFGELDVVGESKSFSFILP